MKGKSIIQLIITIVVIAAIGLVAFRGIGPNNIGGARSINLGLDLAGGVSITYEAVKGNVTNEEMDDAIYKIQKRVETYSTEAEVYREGTNRINVDIPGVTDANAILAELGKPGSLEFVNEAGQVVLTGADIKSSEAGSYPNNIGMVEYVVSLQLTEEGREKFKIATRENIGKTIFIYYDNEIISAPTVQAEIDGEATINGMSSFDEADRLASTIRIGALPIELRELRSNTVGAKLGQEAIETSLLAGLIGMILVIVFLISYYRIPGIAASLALILYAALMISGTSLLDMTLTLPGIAGIILSIAMAVDANIIIFARIREELALGKTARASIKAGFKKALSAIMDGNITTIIVAIVLWINGTGTIKGFAQTLILGIILSMFTAIFISRWLVTLLNQIGFTNPKFYGVQKGYVKFKYIDYRKYFFIFSIIVVLAGFVFMPINKGKIGSILNYSIEFQGGTTTQVTFNEDVSFERIDQEVKPFIAEIIGDTAIEAQKVTGGNEVIFKTRELTLDQRDMLQERLQEAYQLEMDQVASESISGTFSDKMKTDAVISVIIVSIVTILYIWIRFKDPLFGASAVIALLYDIFVIITIYAVLRLPVGTSFVACILTILGYSLNDTIVVFDRIRENKANGTTRDLKQLIDDSANQTLARSLHTSVSTFVVIAILYFLGVEAIKSFALPLMIGTLSGSYSTLFIASPLYYVMKKGKLA